MENTKRKGTLLMIVIAVALLACVVVAIVAALSRRAPEPAPEPKVEVKQDDFNRMKDPEYTKAIKEQLDIQHKTAARVHQIATALEAAKDEDPESEKTKALQKSYDEALAEVAKQREDAQRLVRGRIARELAEREAADKAAKTAK